MKYREIKILRSCEEVQNTSSWLDLCLREKQGLLICEIKGEIQTAIVGIFYKSLPKFRIEFKMGYNVEIDRFTVFSC